MSMPLIISYHTPDPLYTAAADRLRDSLKKFNLKYEVMCCPSRGSWLDNCNYKANFIYVMLRSYARDILWLDADAEVVAYPELFEQITEDVAAVIHREHELLGSTIYFRNGMEAEKLCEAWVLANKAHPGQWDQVNLKMVLNMEPYKDMVKFRALPHSYAQIFDYQYETELPPVIVQHQASRQGRKVYP